MGDPFAVATGYSYIRSMAGRCRPSPIFEEERGFNFGRPLRRTRQRLTTQDYLEAQGYILRVQVGDYLDEDEIGRCLEESLGGMPLEIVDLIGEYLMESELERCLRKLEIVVPPGCRSVAAKQRYLVENLSAYQPLTEYQVIGRETPMEFLYTDRDLIAGYGVPEMWSSRVDLVSQMTSLRGID